jgi:hypothetical protein
VISAGIILNLVSFSYEAAPRSLTCTTGDTRAYWIEMLMLINDQVVGFQGRWASQFAGLLTARTYYIVWYVHVTQHDTLEKLRL